MTVTDRPLTGPNGTAKAIHAYLTPDAGYTWQEIAEEHGVSLSGLLEVLAARIGDIVADDPAITRAARRVDADRRRRDGRRRH